MQAKQSFAAGARVLIRDEEWLVRATAATGTGGLAVQVTGLSELVRNHEAMFLSELDTIEELRPEETRLVADDSPHYRRTRLYLESLLRRTPPTDNRENPIIYLGHRAAMNYSPYQMKPTVKALEALRPRILIADGVGLGKTIEVGVLLAELIKRGRGQRILVVAIRSMLAQFQQEIWSRFAIPLVRLDSVGLQRVRSKIPTNKNPFYYYDRVIVSIDTLKNDAQYRHYLEACHWDVIVIDECHNVANTGSQRNRLAGLLARTSDSLILTSATPHNGKAESFANLMNMLEPTAIADVQGYTADEIQGLFVRRFKKDVEDEVGEHFSDRHVDSVPIQAGRAEEAFFDRLAAAKVHTLGRRSGTTRDALFRIGLLKGFLSSPTACADSIRGRMTRIEKRLAEMRGQPSAAIDESSDEVSASSDHLFDESGPDVELDEWQPALLVDVDKRQQAIANLAEDLQTLADLHDLATAVTLEKFSKYQRLLALLRELNAQGKRNSDRVIIFSERIATLKFLQNQLLNDLGVKENAVAIFHAGLPDVEQQQVVEDFGKKDSSVRILLASDVASEGVNLHYFCHLMIHFDIPWSLITLEQRNGRIDRYGQQHSPQIRYLLTVSQNETVRGDLHILDRLIEKEEEAHRNIGDVGTLLGLYDANQEEQHITKAMAAGQMATEILPDQDPDGDEVDGLDFLQMLMAEVEKEATEESSGGAGDPRQQAETLYADDLAFAQAAFAELTAVNVLPNPPEFHPERPEFHLLTPQDLRRRCEMLPHEVQRNLSANNWSFYLTTDRQRMMQAMDAARTKENTWPVEQLFWELHPVMQWLLDRLLVQFGRHEAPVIVAPALDPSDTIVLFQGVISNRRSQPVITQWFGLMRQDGYDWSPLALDEVLGFTDFTAGIANPGTPSTKMDEIRAALPHAVKAAGKYMANERSTRADEYRKRLQEDLRKLRRWAEATRSRINHQLENAVGVRRARLQYELDEVDKLQRQRATWLNETFSTDPTPYLRVAVVFTGA